MSTRTTVVWAPDWPVVAALRATEQSAHLPAAVLAGSRVQAVSAVARSLGVRRGMRRRQAQEACPELVLLGADEDRDARLFEPVAVAVEAVVAGIEVLRPGLLLLPAGGAARYHGTEDLLAERIVSVVAERTGHECQVGTADGLLAALDGADVHARFGVRGTWAWTLARGDDLRPPGRRRPEADLEVSGELEPPAHRVDVATFVGRRLAEGLHTLLTANAVTCGRLRITARTDAGEDLVRTWRTDTGGLGGLSAARITDRIRWQLDGWLTAGALDRPVDPAEHLDGEDQRDPVGIVRLTVTAEDVAPAGAEQGRLWGGTSGGDLRAHRALDRVQGLLGGDGVLTATLQGGRDVRDQVHLQPWGAQQAPARPADRPWPDRLPAPAPATVPAEPSPVEVLDPDGVPVRLDGRLIMAATPAIVRTPPTGRRPAVDHPVAGWAGPWPLAERWWDAPRVRAHLQVTLADGRALLLSAHPDGWTCEAVYD